jgi:hypothetical protein
MQMSVPSSFWESGDIPEELAAAPGLQPESPQVIYDPETGAVSVQFTFDMVVTAAAQEAESWVIEGSGSSGTITARPAAAEAGREITITLTATNPKDGEAVITVDPVTVIPVSGAFSRGKNAGTYRVSYYDDRGVSALKPFGGGDSLWYYLGEAGLREIFNAVYTPNKPGSGDRVEGGKTAITYTGDISAAALALFNITIGADKAGDRIEIKGTSLPAQAAYSSAAYSSLNLIVVDIGLPGDVDNDGLPQFVIPHQALGQADGGGHYPGIRFRVNRGAEALIEADNSGYERGGVREGAGNSCEPGNFNNGCIEVMAGGKLRDGAYEGFPLGANAVILNRLGSYLAVGPEKTFNAADGADLWYAGWLIGPAESSPRIAWDSGDQNGGYIEVRPTKLAISANVTVKKNLGLIYSVWFVNGPVVTIDAAGDTVTPAISGKKGLFANGNSFRFYGTAETSGGQNPGNPAAKIIVKQGSVLHKAFLSDNPVAMGQIIENGSGDVFIINLGDANSVSPTQYEGSISGYLNWNIPENSTVNL